MKKYLLIALFFVLGNILPSEAQSDACLSIDCSPANGLDGGLSSAELNFLLESYGFGGSTFGGFGLCNDTGICEDGQSLDECYAGCDAIHDMLLDRCRGMLHTHSPSDREACWADAYNTLDACRRRCEGR